MLLIVTEMYALLRRHLAAEEGQGLTEYAMILALIALLAIVALTFLGGTVSNEMSTAARSL